MEARMANFTIRVVLHGAMPGDYEELHDRMARYGARRQITGDSGVVYDLPDGEYDLYSSSGASDVLHDVSRIADSVKPSHVLVTTAGDRAWVLVPVPGYT
jgi:hypothetical protein